MPDPPGFVGNRRRRCAFIKLYGIVGALIAFGLLGLTLLSTVASGWQVWQSPHPAWAWFKASLAGLVFVLVLVVIVLGREFHWWSIDGELLDFLGALWIVLTIAVMAVTYGYLR